MRIFNTIFLIFLLINPIWCQGIVEKEITDWEFRMEGDSVWKKAIVPGTIIDNFANLNDYSNPLHPYYGDNEKLYQWIGEKNWEFRTRIPLKFSDWNKTIDLEFGSLDLFADVYVNGQKYSSNNTFMPLQLKGLEGKYISYNDGGLGKAMDIIIKFHSTIDSVKKLQAFNPLQLPGGARVYARTAQYQFGWDWGPTFINMGIRKPVKMKLIPSDYAHIFKLSVQPTPDSKIPDSYSVLLDYYSSIDTLDWIFNVHLNGDLIHSQTFTNNMAKNDGQQLVLHHLTKPALWWPNGIGETPNVYTFTIQFFKFGSNELVAEKILHHAFCNIQLIKEKDKIGESFYFKVNGERVFAKGANYIPDDSFHPGKKTIDIIRLAKDANMNMLRVWGGGHYPEDDFYIECMKNGIMIWQDYMFACAMYPGDAEFLDNVTNEATYHTSRLDYLGNIAVWCGNNENDEGWKNWGWQKEFKYTHRDSTRIWEDYLKLNDTILRFPNRYYQVRPTYISTSPKYGWGRKESMTHGDSHYWGVWWGLEPIEMYKEKVPRFMSEFGMQAMPDMHLIQKVIPDSAFNFNSQQFKNHQKHPTGFQTINHYLNEYFVIPDNMEEYIYATQVLQSYALQTAIESQRTHMPNCMGSLLWQLNDCWPVTSWSILDYELNKKMGFTQVKKSFMPVMITMKETQTTYDFYVVNDRIQPYQDLLTLYVSDFQGNIKFKKEINVKVNKQSSKKLISIPVKKLISYGLEKIYIHTELKADIRSRKNFHLVKPNQLKLLTPEIKIIQTENDEYFITSNTYCPYVSLPGLNNGPRIAMPDLEPNQPHGLFNDKESLKWIQYLQQNMNKILCLNMLLNTRE